MTEQWTLVEGFLLPVIIAVILREQWGDAAKAIGAFLVCVIFATVTAYIAGQLDLSNPDFPKLLEQILAVLVVSITTYKGFWQKTGIAPAISKFTG